jgi:glucosylceramidase
MRSRTPCAMKRLLLSLMLLSPTFAEETPHWIVTAKAGGARLAQQKTPIFRAAATPDENGFHVFVDPAHQFQTIEGIGGALTDAAAETFAKLPAERQEELLTAYFDRTRGIGYSLGRTHIHSCDFSSHSYAYVEKVDPNLESFSIQADLQHKLPFMQRVLQKEPELKLFASPWSPPAWMKSNQSMLKGGKLLPEYQSAWARYYVKFFEEYQKQGISFWGLTVQNEPMATQTWESCLFSAEEERDFVRDHLGPSLAKSGWGHLKLMVWDHNRGLAYQRGASVLSDPEAARYVWGTAYHWYVGDSNANLELLHQAYPDKAIFFSEGCNYPFSWDTFEDWKWGENYAHSMISDFNHWCTGWTDWNILLDEAGGPNHVQNYCFAPIHADTRKGTLHYQNSYYYIGHFSKYVRPGARRIAYSSSQESLEATAFINQDGQRVAVLLNRTDKPMSCQLWCDGKAARLELPAHAIGTATW